MTSNVGAELLRHEPAVGFRTGAGSDMRHESRVLDELKPSGEFLNRIDETIVFHALSQEHLRSIVDIMLKEVYARLQEHGLTLEVSVAAKDVLTKEGFDPTFGARPLRRAITRLVENPLSEEMLAGRFQAGDTVRVEAEDGKLVFSKPEGKATDSRSKLATYNSCTSGPVSVRPFGFARLPGSSSRPRRPRTTELDRSGLGQLAFGSTGSPYKVETTAPPCPRSSALFKLAKLRWDAPATALVGPGSVPTRWNFCTYWAMIKEDQSKRGEAEWHGTR